MPKKGSPEADSVKIRLLLEGKKTDGQIKIQRYQALPRGPLRARPGETTPLPRGGRGRVGKQDGSVLRLGYPASRGLRRLFSGSLWPARQRNGRGPPLHDPLESPPSEYHGRAQSLGPERCRSATES